MKRINVRLLAGVALTGLFLLSSCHSSYRTNARYQLSKAEGDIITIDSSWDKTPNLQAIATLKPYKDKIDAIMMNEVIGTSETKMEKGIPESLLSNLVVTALQDAGAQVLGHPVDIGLINMGGLRSILPKGDITVNTIYEILPFECSLCVLTMRGMNVKRLFRAVASLHGEGISGARLVINPKGELLNATIGGKPIEDTKLYTVATIDYLADGNGRMDAFLQAEKRECPKGITLRGLFLDYVRKQTAAGNVITSKLDGRITIQ